MAKKKKKAEHIAPALDPSAAKGGVTGIHGNTTVYSDGSVFDNSTGQWIKKGPLAQAPATGPGTGAAKPEGWTGQSGETTAAKQANKNALFAKLAQLGITRAETDLDWMGNGKMPLYVRDAAGNLVDANADGQPDLQIGGSWTDPATGEVKTDADNDGHVDLKNPYSRQAELGRSLSGAKKQLHTTLGDSGRAFDGSAVSLQGVQDHEQGKALTDFTTAYRLAQQGISGQQQQAVTDYGQSNADIDIDAAGRPAPQMGQHSGDQTSQGKRPGESYLHPQYGMVVVQEDGTLRVPEQEEASKIKGGQASAPGAAPPPTAPKPAGAPKPIAVPKGVTNMASGRGDAFGDAPRGRNKHGKPKKVKARR